MYGLSTLVASIIASSNEPISGYDISKIVARKTGNTHQQVYRELKALLSVGGFNCKNVEQSDKPDKKLYYIDGGVKFGVDRPVGDELFDGRFKRSNIGYFLASFDEINGTDLFSEYEKEVSKINKKYAEMAMSCDTAHGK